MVVMEGDSRSWYDGTTQQHQENDIDNYFKGSSAAASQYFSQFTQSYGGMTHGEYRGKNT